MKLLIIFDIIGSTLGWVHTFSALLAMLLGALVVLNKKGTRRHKQIGYGYVFFMLVVNLSAFAIYNTGGPSLFHVFALISLLSVVFGIVPAWRRKSDRWYVAHYYFMSWSVVGLYAAFWSEIGVRFFDMRYFWWAVMVATLFTCGLGAYIINRQAKKLLDNVSRNTK
jgi:uncharacterized membrane protein